jgi:sec-independent protein translocase protein TatA
VPNLGGWELVILLGILVLVFGAKKLPDMARSVGQSARVFKGEMKGLKQDAPEQAAESAPAAEPTTTRVLSAGGDQPAAGPVASTSHSVSTR